ncbi:hypothetical protein PoB_006089800 [Plakobranchus ocellatus]|uniref:Uncharacterized protein n=1 Tax=Plakobranchus ocellatus TaxID=259542 RepID=A0AAV4CR55_9GAST|nr:hypothetical protein PoB_006089800 [Plakobranchus ocellatus]
MQGLMLRAVSVSGREIDGVTPLTLTLAHAHALTTRTGPESKGYNSINSAASCRVSRTAIYIWTRKMKTLVNADHHLLPQLTTVSQPLLLSPEMRDVEGDAELAESHQIPQLSTNNTAVVNMGWYTKLQRWA